MVIFFGWKSQNCTTSNSSSLAAEKGRQEMIRHKDQQQQPAKHAQQVQPSKTTLDKKLASSSITTSTSSCSSASAKSLKIDSKQLLKSDPHLEHFLHDINLRNDLFIKFLDNINECHGGIEEFASGYKTFGVHFDQKNQKFKFLEWVPDVEQVFVYGKFNNYQKFTNPMLKLEYGKWYLELNALKDDGSVLIEHKSELKLAIITRDERIIHRISPWASFTYQEKDSTLFKHLLWNPPKAFRFSHPRPLLDSKSLCIYEAHVGISSSEQKIASYDEFRRDVLPRIHKLGYNCLMLMAISGHALYSSFGYQVTNYFSPASWFGEPDDLKRLIDEAHALGIAVIIDVVYGHSSNNCEDGLNYFNGTDSCFFHSGHKGMHPIWSSRLFDYSNIEVQRLLLSNIAYWMDEFMFDGFRFDAIGTIIYNNLAIGQSFSGDYHQYFSTNSNFEALAFFMLANHLIKTKNKNVLTFAEEVSGYPTLCRPVHEGGIGFDFRLLMGITDLWIKLFKDSKIEDWNMGDIVSAHCNRRRDEKGIVYTECHDQALVGDKTIAFWLMDHHMYHQMQKQPNGHIEINIDTGLSYIKLIKLFTISSGGDGYLNFIGNEFAHPEWLDFPREGNNNSFHYARRLFHLADNKKLYYHDMNQFDGDMIKAAQKYHWMSKPNNFLCVNNGDKVIVLRKGDLLFIFNFNMHKSFTDYKIHVYRSEKYSIVFSTDEAQYAGHSRINLGAENESVPDPNIDGSNYSVKLYMPAKCAYIMEARAK